MHRNDWLWLALKVASIYLVVVGVGYAPALITAMLDSESHWDSSLADHFLLAGVPIGVGIVAFIKADQIVPRAAAAAEAGAPAAPATTSAAGPSMRREDWLWLLFKASGLYLTVLALQFVMFASKMWEFESTAPIVACALLLVAVSGALLFSDRPWRWACRGSLAIRDDSVGEFANPSAAKAKRPRDPVGSAILWFYLVIVLGGLGTVAFVVIRTIVNR